MIKRLPLLMAALLLAGVASAQVLNLSGNRVLKNFPRGQRTEMMRYEQSPRFARYNAPSAPVAADDETEQMWWGYFEGEVANSIGFGSGVAETFWAAIGITNKQTLAQGNSISAIRFGVAGAAYMKNVHVWIAESLPNSLDGLAVDVPVASVNDQAWTEVKLPTPYTVPSKTFYVGYTFEITEANDATHYPVLLRYNGANIDNSFWVRTSESMSSWDDSYKQYGPVALQVQLEGNNFPKNSVAVGSTFNDVFALPGGTAEAQLTLTNLGTNPVTSIDYIIDEANSYSDELHLEVSGLDYLNAQAVVRIPMTADKTSGRTPRTVTITQVNGQDNGNEEAVSDGYFVTLSRAVKRRTVIEEFTGTWCGWCPRGITGLEKVNEQLGDRAITIAVHSDDPMAIDYGVSSGAGYPSAYVDRATVCDPYFGVDESKGLWGLAEEMNQVLAEASVDLEAPVLNKSGNITFKTDVCFNYTNAKSTYALGYVIVADGLTGTGRKWAQANYYCNPQVKDEWTDYADLAQWVNGQDYMPMTYDHVAIAAKGMDGGIEKSIKASIKDGDTITVSGTIALVENPVLQSLDNLKVVSVLFNTTTGTIVNADIQPVTVASDFAVNKMQAKAFETLGTIKGEVTQVPVPVANFGRAGIHSIDYSVRANGAVSDTMRLELKKPITTLGIYEDVNFPVTAPAESGVVSHTINIVAVNGEKNEATTGKISTGSILAMAKASKRRTAVEEFTGTWCMWCPRGLAGLKRARAEYPDDAVLMSIHGGSTSEPMLVSAFNTLLNSVGGFPSANVNRYRSVDPYMGEGDDGWGLGAVIEDENSKMVEAAVNLQQPVLDETTSTINFTTDVTFQINRKSAPYLLSYVLVADGLHGEGDDWKQVNAYAAYYAGSYEDDPYMNEVCNIWDVYADVTFNDVAIAGLGVGTGVTGSLKTTVEEGQTQSHTSKFSIKSNKLAQMAAELRVIALLYDKTRKVIINADEKKVVSSSDTPVRDVNTAIDATPLQRYGIDGTQRSHATRGINLIRMSDGSVRKVMTR
ncbi:MAG: thioredoxin family protein [Bacteroidaceae bacterium]|nr:thioredoxin family protein [Bacteroidaceae bacterium]